MVHGVIKRENQKWYLGEKDWSWQRDVHKKGRDKRELRKWPGIYLDQKALYARYIVKNNVFAYID